MTTRLGAENLRYAQLLDRFLDEARDLGRGSSTELVLAVGWRPKEGKLRVHGMFDTGDRSQQHALLEQVIRTAEKMKAALEEGKGVSVFSRGPRLLGEEET